jgi:hypothetical protein
MRPTPIQPIFRLFAAIPTLLAQSFSSMPAVS